MKKTLLATAIAGAMGFSMAAQALEAPTVYGNVQLRYNYADTIFDETEADMLRNDSSSQLTDGGSTVGFQGSHDLGQGLTGIYKAEFQYTADEASGLNGSDQAFAGVQGAFGTVKAGSFDTVYNNFVEDSIDVGEGGVTSLGGFGAQTEEGDQINFTSNSINGLVVAADVQFKGDAEDAAEKGGKTDSNTAFVVGASYTMGNITLAAAFDNAGNAGDDVDESFGAAVAVDLGQIGLSGKFENVGDDNAFGGAATFDYGMGSLFGGVQVLDSDAADDQFTEILVGGTYNVADNLYVFASAQFNDKELVQAEIASGETEFSTGLNYGF